MKPHAFVAMPFGTKPDADGKDIDFNAVYETLLRPALEDAGCEVFRADEEQRAGDIRSDMFQELLVADLVLADLTIDNPNVWYELGVRHALRARGVVLVQGPRKTSPFDIYTDRKIRYALADGRPDPASLEHDRAAIAGMARETLAASTRRKVSPVYVLLPHLQQPQWQQLMMDGDNEFGAAYQEWKRRMEVARQKSRAGDILVLADETPIRALATEARVAAGRALMKLWQFGFALEQFDAALAIEPEHAAALQQRVVALGRIGRFEEAREAAHALTDHRPDDPEGWALAGRVEKEAWLGRWRPAADDASRAAAAAAPGALREAAAAEDALLAEAVTPYLKAFTLDATHHYSGINALTLNVLRAHLGGEHDPELTERLLGGVRWAVTSALEAAPKDYWARATLAELSLLCLDREAVRREWKAAAAAAGRDWFALDSSRQTLAMLAQLGFRPEETALALGIVEAEIARLAPPFVPRQVLLFSGHMVDRPGRALPRFPAAAEAIAAKAIDDAVGALDPGADDLALSQAAAGGDLLFLEACQRRGVRCQIMLPFAEPEFIERSVLPSIDGARWRDRYYAASAAANTSVRAMPSEVGALPDASDPFERCNLWLLYTALAAGIEKTRFVTLWNGEGGDGPGGTAHLAREIKRHTGRVVWLDTRELFRSLLPGKA